MADRKLTVVLAGDSKGLERMFGSASKSASGFGSKMGKFASVAALGLAGVGAGAVAMGKQLYDAAIESQKVTKQTEAVIKSMGGASNVTADQVAKLSTALSNKTAQDDEMIQSGANVLLTFGKVRNEIGAGNDIFNRATTAALDMSVALGTDMKGASIQVGKALNDPIKGLTALSRAGVSFTAEQKEQVKAMVAVGDTLGAQKLILSELDKQFSGSAAAQATAGERLGVVWGNLQEQLGEKLIPIIEAGASWLGDKLPGAFDTAGRFAAPFVTALGHVNDSIAGVVGTIQEEGFLKGLGSLVSRGVDWMGAVGLPALWAKLQQWGNAFVAWIGPRIGPFLQELGRYISVAAQWMISTGLPTLGQKLGEWGRAFVEWIAPRLPGLLSQLSVFVAAAAAWIVLKGAPAFMAATVQMGLAFIGGILNGIGVKKEELFDWFRRLPQTIVNAVGNLGRVLYDKGRELLGGFVSGIRDAAGGIGSAIGGAISGAISKIPGVGDGFGRPRGGTTLAKIQSILPPGLSISSTYRSPAHNRRVGGSPTSYHMDRSNPAVDIVGPTGRVDAFVRRLRQIGGWRELLWQVPGHFDHAHVAHEGGVVSSSWARMPGLRADERPAILQVGERVIPRGEASGGNTYVFPNFVGSRQELARELDWHDRRRQLAPTGVR